MIVVRWLLIAEVVTQPIVLAWFVILALRIQRDQEAMATFLKVWGDRLLATTTVRGGD